MVVQTHTAAKESSSHTSKPFFDSRPAHVTDFFTSSHAIHTQLTVGKSGDRFEREADAVADAVVQRKVSRASSSPDAQSVQAKCSQCDQEEAVQRQVGNSTSDNGTNTDSVQQGLTAQRGAGQSLDASLRQDMEQGIGGDFSGVRIHTGAPAANLNDALHARAFTHGQDVFFNSGQFDPGSSSGRHLLAHELTHVVQQSGNAPNIQRDDAGGGSTEFSDTVSSTVRSGNSPVISGTVTRTETAPASDSSPREVISTGRMNIAFDPTSCAVTIPFGYRFVQAPPANAGPCDAGANHTLLSPADFTALKANVLSVVNAGLNGWYDVRLDGSACRAAVPTDYCRFAWLPLRTTRVRTRRSRWSTARVARTQPRSARSRGGTPLRFTKAAIRLWDWVTSTRNAMKAFARLRPDGFDRSGCGATTQ